MNKVMKYIFLPAVFAALAAAQAFCAIKIAASLPDFASIASNIGGDKIEVFSIAKGNTNPHSVEVLPSYMMKIAKCKIYLKVGLSLDQWADQLIDGSGNSGITVVNCSEGIDVLEKNANINASQGHVHPDGNPHYWLNPLNAVIIAGNIKNALVKADPANASFYEANFSSFKTKIESKAAQWKEAMKNMQGKSFISYHSSWVYFADAFGMKIAANIEPFPGIPPTAKHLEGLIRIIKDQNTAFILQEGYFSDSAPNFLRDKTGIRVIKRNPSCGGTDAGSYFDFFDSLTKEIAGTAVKNDKSGF